MVGKVIENRRQAGRFFVLGLLGPVLVILAYLPLGLPAQTRVGVIAPLTGDFVRYGESVVAGTRRGAGANLSLIIEDEGCESTKTVSAYRKLSNTDGVRFFLGPMCGSPQVALAPLLARGSQVAIVGSSAPKSVYSASGGRMFSSQHTIEQESAFNAAQAYRLGARRMLIVFAENSFSRSHEAAFREAFAGEVLETIAYTAEDSKALDGVAIKVKTSGVDSIYVPDALPLLQGLMQKLHRLRLGGVKVFSVYSTESEDVLKMVRKEGEGLIYSYPDIGDKIALEYFPELAARILSAAVAKCGSNDDACVLAALKRDNSFDEYGALQGNIKLKTIRNGKFADLETPSTGIRAPIKIGWIGPLSGDSAFLGVDSVEAARLVFDDVNRRGGVKERKLELIAEDDQYLTPKTVAAYSKLVNLDHVSAIFVLTYGGMLALAPRAEKDSVLLFDPLDCDDDLAALPQNSFCVAKKTEDMGIVDARHAWKRGFMSAGIIYVDGDPFLPKVAQSTKDEFEKLGGKVLLHAAVARRLEDATPALIRAKEKGVDVLFLYGYEWFAGAFKKARELGINVPFYSITNLETPGSKAAGGDSLRGTIASGWFAPRTPAYSAFLESYRKKVGRAPLLEISTVPTYDLANLIVKGIEHAMNSSEEVSVARLREFIYGIKNYQGLSGSITMDPDGAVRSLPVGIYEFDGNSYIPRS